MAEVEVLETNFEDLGFKQIRLRKE